MRTTSIGCDRCGIKKTTPGYLRGGACFLPEDSDETLDLCGPCAETIKAEIKNHRRLLCTCTDREGGAIGGAHDHLLDCPTYGKVPA